MKTLLVFLLSGFFFIAAHSQSDDDNIEYLRVQNQINEGNYRKALTILSQMSASAKNNSFYLTYSATCYEKLNSLDSAALFYKQLYSVTKNFDVMKKVAELKDRQDEKINCTRCHGTGFYTKTVVCPECKGVCFSCHGSGKCRFCDGTGVNDDGYYCRLCDDTHEISYTKKLKFPGNGKCQECHGTGKNLFCKDCKGTGEIIQQFVCYH